jgi:glycosyltransferase involved in cell wall biosynthesis
MREENPPGIAGERPLLTLAIPTYNRSANLALLLKGIGAEIAGLPEVELLVSDNASPDDTEEVMREFLRAGLRCRYIRNASNIGADANFLQCYTEARGTYLWVFGDDDVLFPGSLRRVLRYLAAGDVDLVYLAPFGFMETPNERGQADARPAVFALEDARRFVHAVGLRGDLVMLSAVIVNKERVDSFPHADFELGGETNLLQLGWTFAALRHMRRGLIFERGLYAVCEVNPQRPFDVVGVFGVNWHRAANLYLEGDPGLIRAVLKDQLYAWFPTNWFGMRRRPELNRIVDPVGQMRPLYGGMGLFWVATWPLLAWPLPLAGVWLTLLRMVRRMDLLVNRRVTTRLDARGVDSQG